jgi:hypothetical protein
MALNSAVSGRRDGIGGDRFAPVQGAARISVERVVDGGYAVRHPAGRDRRAGEQARIKPDVVGRGIGALNLDRRRCVHDRIEDALASERECRCAGDDAFRDDGNRDLECGGGGRRLGRTRSGEQHTDYQGRLDDAISKR